jgi:hypothetical protein
LYKVLGIVSKSQHLSDTVLIALITTTTINVLALFAGVIKYVFYRPGDDRNPPKVAKIKKEAE